MALADGGGSRDEPELRVTTDDPPFDLEGTCRAATHPEGPCPVDGMEELIEELHLLAVAAGVERDARLAAAGHAWTTVAEDGGVRVVVPT